SSIVFFSSWSRHTRFSRDWSSDVCSSDLLAPAGTCGRVGRLAAPVVPVGQGGLVLLVERLVILDKLGVLGVQSVVARLKRPFGVDRKSVVEGRCVYVSVRDWLEKPLFACQ